jgi:hypothetical protein
VAAQGEDSMQADLHWVVNELLWAKHCMTKQMPSIKPE